MGCSLVKSGFFLYCVIKHVVDRAPKRSFMKNASALLVTESERGNLFILTVFSESVVIGTKVPFNASEVIAL